MALLEIWSERQECPLNMMLADNNVNCSESRGREGGKQWRVEGRKSAGSMVKQVQMRDAGVYQGKDQDSRQEEDGKAEEEALDAPREDIRVIGGTG